jgi:cell wall-associated NlpC family hydrolase
MRKVSNNPLPRGNDYNCYCFALYTTGLYDKIHWMDKYDLEEILENSTIEVKDPLPGDIAVFWGYDSVYHAAVYVNKDRFIHKPGHWE